MSTLKGKYPLVSFCRGCLCILTAARRKAGVDSVIRNQKVYFIYQIPFSELLHLKRLGDFGFQLLGDRGENGSANAASQEGVFVIQRGLVYGAAFRGKVFIRIFSCAFQVKEL